MGKDELRILRYGFLAGFPCVGIPFAGPWSSGGGMMVGLFFNCDFIKSFLRASDCDINEVLFLFFHPGLSGKLRRHPSVTTEEIDSGPFETFGFVNRRES